MLVRQFTGVVVGLVLLLIPSVAGADGHRAGGFGGISFARGSVVTGFHVAGEYSFGDRDAPYFDIAGDVSTHFIGKDPSINVFMFRVSYGPARTDRARKFVPVFHAMIGGVHIDGAGGKGAGAIGLSHDFILPSPSARSNAKHHGIRVQYDRIIIGDDIKDVDRFSVGYVLRSAKR